MPTPATLTLSPDDHAQARALAWLEGLADEHGWPRRTLFALQLCLEESLANILMHGFARPPRPEDAIELQIQQAADRVTLRICDNGPAFDPTARASVPPAGSLDEAVPGGHGLRLMRHYLRDLHYRHAQGCNQLTLVAALDPGTHQGRQQ
ncbi:MAG: ATP-binding protein [Castellaniella sp.]